MLTSRSTCSPPVHASGTSFAVLLLWAERSESVRREVAGPLLKGASGGGADRLSEGNTDGRRT